MSAKKLFRKLHLWLSVPFGVCITLICFSGAMMVFEKEITELCRHDLYFVKEVKSSPLPMDSLMATVSAAMPDSVSVTGVTVFQNPKRAWQVTLSKPRRASVYVDQYTGEIKGSSGRLPFYDTMFRLHRWMLGSSGGTGKLIVGISTLVLVIILLTGILMWLTNRNKPLTRSLTISFNKGWQHFWHDLHVAGGIYATVFLLCLALTGLTWSFSWYRNGFYSMFGAETSAGAGHSAANNSTRTDSHGRAGHGREQNGNDGNSRQSSPYAHWQDVYRAISQQYPDYRQITISNGSVSVIPKERRSLRVGDVFQFNPRNGEITGTTPYSSQDRTTKIRSAVYIVHVGSWGGTLTRILTFIAALLGASLPLTGYYLWIRRLTKKKR